jgi:hypothetical protein
MLIGYSVNGTRAVRRKASDPLMTIRMVFMLLLLSPIHGCRAETTADTDSRTLATIDAALDEDDLPADLLAQQNRLFEALAENRLDELPRYLDLTFRFRDIDNPAPTPAVAAVGSPYLPGWREPGGLNYYQFLARDVRRHAWTGRTLEIVWSFPGSALVVAHHDETDPVFTQWQIREDGWKVMRLTINNSDETLQQARESRRSSR